MAATTPAAPARLSYTKREAAKSLGVSVRTIERLAQDGRLRCVKLGRKVVVPVDALAALLANGRA